MAAISHDDNNLDFEKLEKELNAAVIADERYNRENDAKFRAVHQRVATYEEFKDIVAASHLKPLGKGDKINGAFKQPWNVHASQHSAETSATSSQTAQKEENKFPETSHGFLRDWRQVYKTTTQRYEFLLALGAQRLGIIFAGEIGFGLLGDFLLVLSTGSESDGQQVVQILEALTTTNRFSLSVQFLSKAEKDTCEKLFSKLRSQNCGSADIIDRLDKLNVIYQLQ